MEVTASRHGGQLQTADKGGPPASGLGVVLKAHHKKISFFFLQNFTIGLIPGEILWIIDLS
jgi:hypothetical protein